MAPPGAEHSWQGLPAAQQPQWPDAAALRATVAELSALPPLVLATECDRLRERLALAARGEAMVLQGGDCAEAFHQISSGQVRAKVRTLRQMADVLSAGAGVPVVTVGRLAGQYSKPRSQPVEVRGGVALPSYRGDSVNGPAFTKEARRPDPGRLHRMYGVSAATLNLLRALAVEGFAPSHEVRAWNREFVASAPARRRFAPLLRRGVPVASGEVFTSHEALLLDYEGALARPGADGGLYALSGHMVWIGERTRQLDGAHVEFASRVRNPVGVKLGPGVSADEVLALADRIDPDREPGRLTFISRMGTERVRDVLPGLVDKARAEGLAPVWLCDPMHGNTFAAPSGHKTRSFDAVLDEVAGFFEVHRALGTHAGGVHLELTGDHVTECVGGLEGVGHEQLHERYETACDPRLNHAQSVELAFRTAELLAG
ncbi:3-deoxy-7-phosphoheptulonate synthase class II [Streptomyces alanosinicus]|uniref:3-deoxy-7-phosphoheptulonate synthase class II n=1 Tax=Streptomyces alanosinicus TaxID=68171 RepID=UPI001E5BDC7A|nr:3-deoxy-7-phosphoheptulonate synthase class II [Streptomyces alanosinicus]